MSEWEIKYRNKIIRSYLKGRIWDKNPEFQLIRSVVSKEYPDKILCKNLEQYPYVIEFEWEVISGLSNAGKGDLIFSDEKNNFLIVECKYLDPLPLYGTKLVFFSEINNPMLNEFSEGLSKFYNRGDSCHQE